MPLFRQFATMTPFALRSPAHFLPVGPPPLTSARYARDLAEVAAFGSATSSVRTAEQTQTAIFWQNDTPAAMWNRVADQLALASYSALVPKARLLAQVNMALADTTIGIWNAKNTYNFWRPVTAIRASSEPAWTPLLLTPAFQEYPSGHAGVSSAAAWVLASFYGNATSFTVTSAGLPLPCGVVPGGGGRCLVPGLPLIVDLSADQRAARLLRSGRSLEAPVNAAAAAEGETNDGKQAEAVRDYWRSLTEAATAYQTPGDRHPHVSGAVGVLDSAP